MRYSKLAVLGTVWIAIWVAFFVFAPRAAILSHLNDDAFYYFQIARNVLDGHGISFDGLTPTNGFHPLYLAALLPIFAPFHHADFAPIRIALILLALLYAGTAFLVADVVGRLAGRRPGAWAGAAWLLNPLFLNFARGGLEVPLYTFLVALCFRDYVCRFRDRPSAGGAIRLGLIAGLAICARMDGVIPVAAVGGDFLLHSIRDRRPAGRVAGWLGAALVTAALPLLPWIVWNLHTFGTVIQVSARSHAFSAGSGRTIAGAFRVLLGAGSLPAIAGATIAGLALLAILVRALILPGREIRPRLWNGLFLILYLGVFFGIEFGWYRWWRNWYFLAPAMAFLALLAVVFLGWESAGPRARRWGWAAFVSIWAATAAAGLVQFAKVARDGPRVVRVLEEELAWESKNLPPGAIVGSFNAGMRGYFIPQTVVNLDGLVNNRAASALAAKRLDEYVLDTGITYVVDRPGFIRYFFGKYGGHGEAPVKPVASIGPVTVYRVLSRSERGSAAGGSTPAASG